MPASAVTTIPCFRGKIGEGIANAKTQILNRNVYFFCGFGIIGAMIQKKPLIGVGVLVLKGDLILMWKRQTSHGTGFWAFPGGHLEFNERVEECVKRELFEETGLVAKTIIKGPWKEVFFESDSKHYINLFGIVREFSGSLENKEPQKSSEWKWFPIDQLPSPLFHPIESIAKDGSLVDFLVPYRKPKLSYLCAPFSHPDPTIQQARYEEITAAAGHLIKAGTYVYSPLTHNIPIKKFRHHHHMGRMEAS